MKKIVLLLFTALLLIQFTACNSNNQRKSILKIYNWADYIDEELLTEFKQWYFQQTGENVEIIYQLFDINEIMLAKIERGKEDFDVACPSDYIIERMLQRNLLLPIERDFGTTPNYTSNVSPYITGLLSKINGKGKDANDYAVGYMWGTTGFLYNTSFVSKEDIASWDVLWREGYEDKIFVKDAFRDVYTPLLIYSNYSKLQAGTVTLDELMYDVTDSSIAVVENLLMQSKGNVAGWEADFGKEMMTKEKAWINLTWSGDAMWAMEEALNVGVKLDYAVPQEGSNVWFDGWVIPKYAKNIKAAKYFINFMCKPENAIRNMDATGYVSVIGTEEILEQMNSTAVEEGYTEEIDAGYFFGENANNVILNQVLYPNRSVIERCAMMHDSGPRTEAMLEMWSRVKGNSLNNWMVIFILVVFGALAVVGIIRKAKQNKLRNKIYRRTHYK